MITAALIILTVIVATAQLADLIVDYRYWRKHGRVAYLLRDDWWSFPLAVANPTLLVAVGVSIGSRPTVAFGMACLIVLLVAAVFLPGIGRRQR